MILILKPRLQKDEWGVSRVDAKKGERGFTLIEVIVSLAIFGVVLTSVYNVNLTAWRFWTHNQNKIDLKQQARVMAMYLEKDIKKATAVEIKDVDGDGEDELLFRFGEEGSNYRYDYCQYNVKDKKFTKIIPKDNGDKDDLIVLPENEKWPEWGNNSPITMEIVDSHKFTYDEDKGLVSFRFELVQDKQSYLLTNKIHPRILK